MPVLKPLALIEDRITALREFHKASGLDRAEIDVSGGIDSAVMLQLLCRALSPERVTAVYIGIDSSDDSRSRAREAATACGASLVEIDLTDLFSRLQSTAMHALEDAGYDLTAIEARIATDPTVLGSIRSCLRAPVGRGVNRLTGGGIRHGTGNECEDRFLRFYQKGGDGEVDTNPIAMLSKGEVFQLACALDVPRSILTALPSPDLHGTGAEHSDEDELRQIYGVDWSYSKVDPDSASYTHVGSIERMARLLDEPGVEDAIFGPQELSDATRHRLVATAREAAFHGCTDASIETWIQSARRIERVTRHKLNPNCPTLGNRQPLLTSEILSNQLPES